MCHIYFLVVLYLLLIQQDDYIHQIVEKAVKKEASSRITVEAKLAVADIKEDMSKKIQKEVSAAYRPFPAEESFL